MIDKCTKSVNREHNYNSQAIVVQEQISLVRVIWILESILLMRKIYSFLLCCASIVSHEHDLARGSWLKCKSLQAFSIITFCKHLILTVMVFCKHEERETV